MHALPMQELPYDPNQVTPGVIGFAATALVAIVVMLLMWDFNRRVRRINDRAEIQERLRAEVDAARADDGAQAAAGAETTSAETTGAETTDAETTDAAHPDADVARRDSGAESTRG